MNGDNRVQGFFQIYGLFFRLHASAHSVPGFCLYLSKVTSIWKEPFNSVPNGQQLNKNQLTNTVLCPVLCKDPHIYSIKPTCLLSAWASISGPCPWARRWRWGWLSISSLVVSCCGLKCQVWKRKCTIRRYKTGNTPTHAALYTLESSC